jgi:Mrp family chromosome partitioning ATPase
MSEENCTHNCESCSSDCNEREQPDTDFRESPHELSNIKKVIGIVSGKGGVGKSLVTSMLAVLLNRRGYKTAILDADITGPSIPKMFGIKAKAQGDDFGLFPVRSKTGIRIMSVNLLLANESDPVVWRGPIIAGTVKQFWTDVIWDEVDFMFVDMPPGTGDVALTVFQSIPLDGVIIVTSPQELVSMIVTKAVNMANMMNIPIIGIVENMSFVKCPDCNKKIKVFGESHVKEISEKYSLQVLGELPINPDLAKVCDDGVVELFEGDWLNSAADILEKI